MKSMIIAVGVMMIAGITMANWSGIWKIPVETTDTVVVDQGIAQVQNTKKPKEDAQSIPNPTTKPTKAPEKWVGVSEAGKADTMDASIVSKKMNKYDYNNDGKKVVFLTFDDGASTTVTPKILKVLDKYDVKATFFVMGQNIENGGAKAKALIKQEFEAGHAIANHSYSHDYRILYPNRALNLKNFINDFKKTDRLLKSIIGENFSTRVIRCPGGFMSWKNMDELSEYMKKHDMYSIDWNALSKDAEGKKKNANELLECVKETGKGKNMVVLLMHDTYGKEETVKALPKIIEYYKKNGYVFKTLS